MDCKLCRENIKEYIKNELTEEAMREFAYHLTQCPDCRREVEQTVKMNNLLNSWQAPELSPGFDIKLKERLKKETRPWWQQLGNALSWPAVTTGAAATVIILAAGLMIFKVQPMGLPADKELFDIAVVEETEILENLELIQNLELFKNWEEIKKLEDYKESRNG